MLFLIACAVLYAAEAQELSQTYLTVKRNSSKRNVRPGVGVSIPQKLRQEDCKFEANLGYCVTLSGGRDVISRVVLSAVSRLCLMGSLQKHTHQDSSIG